MRKIILISTMLFSSLSFSQDLEYAKKINYIDPDDVVEVANDILSNFREGYEIMGFIDSRHSPTRTVIAVSHVIPEAQRKKYYEENGRFCDLCQTIDFGWVFIGADKDLEIEGAKKFRLKSINAKFLDLAKWWQKHFTPNNSFEEIRDSYSLQDVKNSKENIHIRLRKDGDAWEVRNYK